MTGHPDFATVFLLADYLFMNHDKLHGVAQNFAAPLEGRLSFVVPHQIIHAHVFADFQSRKAQEACLEGEFKHALSLLKNAFSDFCGKSGLDVSDCRTFLVRLIAGSDGNSYVIIIQDRNARRSPREYVG